ncbi:Arm DNA-binding domain-containing protein [Salmonella enterica]
MALTDTAIRKIKPTEKSFKITDSSGLYLLIKPNGSKLWYIKYRIDGKEKKLAFVAIWRRGLDLGHGDGHRRYVAQIYGQVWRSAKSEKRILGLPFR